MNIIHNYNWITNTMIKIKSYREGYLTNFFINENRFNLLLKHNLMYSVEYEKCIFILYKDYDFYHIYFLATNKERLDKMLNKFVKQYSRNIFVVDIIGSNLTIEVLSRLFKRTGFERYVFIYRMVRLKNLDAPQIIDPKVIFAPLDYSEQIYNILEGYYDKYSEQIPLHEEVIQWLTNNNVLTVVEQKKIIGFVIFEITGITSYLRYWFTHPDYRNQKIGSALLRRFFHESRNTKRQLFWVISTNENAIIRYKHYGFKAEQMFDQVMIKYGIN